MSNRKKFFLMGVMAFWGMVVYAIGWWIVSATTSVSSVYTISVFQYSVVVSRWWDVIFFPIHLNITLAVYLWIVVPCMEGKYGIFSGGFEVVFFVALVLGFVMGFEVGFGASLIAGLVVGLVTLISYLVKIHKQLFEKIK